MSRVQSVNTLALAHPCLLAGPKGVGPFYCPAEPINTMRCCHALDPGMPMMSSTGFDSRRNRRASDGPIRSRRRSPYPAIVRCIPARHLSRPHAAHSIRRYHDGKARNDAGPWRDQAARSRHSIARAPRWPSGFRRAAHLAIGSGLAGMMHACCSQHTRRRGASVSEIVGSSPRTPLSPCRLTERHHTGCMTTPEAHRRMSDWFLAHGREERESAEKARERSIAVKASAEAALDRAVVLAQGRPPKGRRGFRMPWRF